MLKFKRFLKVALTTLLFAGIAQASVESTIISQPPGNGWYTYGTTFSRLIPEATHNEYKIKLIPRGGGMTNPVVVNDNKADFGFSTSNAIVWAREGLTDLYKGKQYKEQRLVFGNMQEAYTIVVARKSWVEQTGNNTLEKIVNANKVVIATKPTTAPIQAPIAEGFLPLTASNITQVKAAAADAVVVVANAATANELADKADPALNPSQPNQSNAVPKMT